jgi:hypothetical protein
MFTVKFDSSAPAQPDHRAEVAVRAAYAADPNGTIAVSTGIAFDAARLLVAEGVVPTDGVRFLSEDGLHTHTPDGRLYSFPEDCDVKCRLLAKLISRPDRDLPAIDAATLAAAGFVVEFDGDNGLAVPDVDATKTVLHAFEQGVPVLTVGTDVMYTAARVLVALGTIPATAIRFQYRGEVLPHDASGKIHFWPKPSPGDLDFEFTHRRRAAEQKLRQAA